MPSAVRLREEYLAEELRVLAWRSKDANESRRLLSLAASFTPVYTGVFIPTNQSASN
jgi:hypothetical protein